MAKIIAPAVIRGDVISSNLVEFIDRDGGSFSAPDPGTLIERLPLRNPGAMRELYSLKTSDIIDYLVELGSRLNLKDNLFLQEALEQSYAMSDLTPSVLTDHYRSVPARFTREALVELAETAVGIRYLDGWVEQTMYDGVVASVRAFGARSVHIVAGNSPQISAMTIARNAITRGDAIIKTPSNDPLTSLAIARTMVEMAPDHPVTRHLSCAYWKGGDTIVEEKLYRPEHVEKILAWGGMASVKHVTRYIQPGLELISLDPKRSATVIGEEAFADIASMEEAALRAATDVGAMNQLGCVNARVIYVVTGSDDDGLEKAGQFARMLYDQIQSLPPHVSTPAKRFDPELRANVNALRASEDFYSVVGGHNDEGAVIVSLTGERLDFYTSLSGRVANVVPIDAPEEALAGMNSWTQTIGIYPEALKQELRDLLPLYGAQRLVSLGYAMGAASTSSLPQDAIEPVRRMVKWIVDETMSPDTVAPLWLRGDETQQAPLVPG